MSAGVIRCRKGSGLQIGHRVGVVRFTIGATLTDALPMLRAICEAAP